MISLKDIVRSQTEAKTSSFNTDLFKNDREGIEWDKSAYSEMHLVSMDNVHDRGEHDNLKETVVCVGHESDFYLITAITTTFNGETQHNYTSQELTLKGFNYFGKSIEEDLSDVYNHYLQDQGYDITIEDIVTIGELNIEYNVTTLRYRDDKDSMHYLTVNAKHQLSGITVKHSAREVKPKKPITQSAFR